MLWLKVLPGLVMLLVALLVIRWEVRHEKKKKGKLRTIVLPLLYLVAASMTVVVIALDHRNAAEAESRSASEKKELRIHLDRIEAQRGSENASKRYREAELANSRPFAQENTREAAARFFASEPQQKRVAQSASDLNELFARAQGDRLQPVVDFVGEKIDAWVDEIKLRGVRVSRTSKPMIAVAERPNTSEHNLITIMFETGHRLEFQVLSAVTENGAFVQNLHMQAPFSQPGASHFEVWTLGGSDRVVELRNPRSQRLNFKPFTSNAAVPIRDTSLRDAINQSLDEVFVFTLAEVRKSQPGRP